ncbi:MAG: flagellar basal body rod protein FlgB [Clostridiales bacterium]|nr:flagellar basal body rod protein FlgB [Clostridiales bacterium]
MEIREVTHLEAALKVLGERQKLLAHNLANVDTPGYRRVDVDFAEAFEAALAGKSIPYHREAATFYKPDGNGVDVDSEMALLAETTLHYQSAAQMLSLALGRYQTAITGRSR